MSAKRSIPVSSAFARVGQRLGASLQGLPARQQKALRLAAWVVGVALLWWVALAPAVSTLRQARAQHIELDKSLGRMQEMAASAEIIRTQNAAPVPAPEVARQALEQATSGLGAGAQLAQQGDRVTVTLREIPAATLAQWLQQVRVNARVVPVQVQLQRSGNNPSWTGQVVLGGPGLGGQ
jgi:general secretion pathway protein M